MVVDDDKNGREGLSDLLEEEGFVVTAATDGAEALALFADFRPDLVLSDICMPNMNGLALARALRASPRMADTPLILLSARHEKARRLEALEAGADDFVAKPLELDELLARVRAHLRRARRHSQVVRMSIIDELTSILNRRGLFELLTQEIARANEDGTPLSVLYVDVDGFKKVNDDYGHAAGDEVLKRTADLLQETAPKSAFVGRLGGDELVVLLPRCDGWGAAALAARVRSVEGPDGSRITLSVGVATLQPGETADDLIGRADERMYEEKIAAKEKGRGRSPKADTSYVRVPGRQTRRQSRNGWRVGAKKTG